MRCCRLRDNTITILILVLVASSLASKLILFHIPYCSVDGIVSGWASFSSSVLHFLGVEVINVRYPVNALYTLLTIPLALVVFYILVSIVSNVYRERLYPVLVVGLELDIISNLLFLYPVVMHNNMNICNMLSNISLSKYNSNLGTIILGDFKVYYSNIIDHALVIIIILLLAEILIYIKRL